MEKYHTLTLKDTLSTAKLPPLHRLSKHRMKGMESEMTSKEFIANPLPALR